MTTINRIAGAVKTLLSLESLHHTDLTCPQCRASVSKNADRLDKPQNICWSCESLFLDSHLSKKYQDAVKQYCQKLYANGMNFSEIQRTTGVNHNLVMHWVKQATIESPYRDESEDITDISQDRRSDNVVKLKNTVLVQKQLSIKTLRVL